MSLLSMPSVAASQMPANTPSLLLLIWLHGFKGGDDTFESFPDRLASLLSENWPQTKCTSIVYPAYDTRGSLSKATELFLDWLTVKTTEHENAYANTAMSQKSREDIWRNHAHVILLGHSMGGLVIADATLQLIRERDSQADSQESIIWPGIIGLIGYDTPYYGLKPSFLNNAANEYMGHARSAQQVINKFKLGLGIFNDPNSGNKGQRENGEQSDFRQRKSNSETNTPPKKSEAGYNWMKLGLAAAGLAVAAGTGYIQKDNIAKNIGWAASHLDYIKELFEIGRLNQRMTEVMRLQPAVNFHCFYTEISKENPDLNPHFIALPTPSTMPYGIDTHFSANQNYIAQNEINAHMTMFNQNLNSGYWDLGRESTRLISEWFRESQQRRISLNQKIKQNNLKFSFQSAPTPNLQKLNRLSYDDQIRHLPLRNEF